MEPRAVSEAESWHVWSRDGAREVAGPDSTAAPYTLLDLDLKWTLPEPEGATVPKHVAATSRSHVP